MKRFTQLFAVALVLFPLAGAVRADVCNLDVNPAATLLLPYFEVDLDKPDGVNTVFSVNNSSYQAALAHVTVWSDLSVPIFDFNVYLTGYDMEVINLRDLFVNGNLPQTASAGQDPADTLSPHGPISQDINFASCNGQLPLPPTLPPIFITHIQGALTGQPTLILGNRCAGRDLGDRIARGYITVDTVNNCTLRFPYDVGYFGPGGDATDDNILFGDFTISKPAKKSSVGMPLVHIQASATDPETSTPGQYTFYGRFVNWTAADHREPLATNFGARYTEDTDLIVWRDSKVNQNVFNCPAQNGTPAWYKLGQEEIVVFDQQENMTELSDVRPFPAEAQRTKVGGNKFPTPYTSGWAFLNLNTAVAAAGANPPEDPNAAQAWVGVVIDEDNGRMSSGFDALRYDSACSASHTAINP